MRVVEDDLKACPFCGSKNIVIDTCQYLCGEYGTVTACHRADTGLSCEFVERSEN